MVNRSNDIFGDLIKRAEELKDKNEILLGEVLTDQFISKNTNFSSLGEFFENSGFPTDTEDEFESIPEAELDSYVSKNSNFNSWDSMLEKAVGEYYSKKLGL